MDTEYENKEELADEQKTDPEGETEAEGTITYDEESKNLVVDFEATEAGKLKLKEIAKDIWDEYSREWEASETFRKQWAKDGKLLAGKRDPQEKETDLDKVINVPILMDNLNRLILKSMGEIVGDWSKVCAFAQHGPTDVDSEKKSLYINYQLRAETPDFPRQLHKGVTHFYMGSVSAHSYYDKDTGTIRHEILGPEDLVIPYQRKTMMPDLSDSPFLIRRRFYYAHELEKKEDEFEHIHEVLDKDPPSWESDELESESRKVADGITKKEEPEGGKSRPYLVLEYLGWMELPGQERRRYVQAYLESQTKKLLAMTIHEEPSWKERLRYETQTAELNQYRTDAAQYQAAQIALSAYQVPELAGGEQGVEGAEPGVPESSLQEPMPPMWMKNPEDPEETPEPMKREPLFMLSHTVCFEATDGSEGVGLGTSQGALNRVANLAMEQYLAAAEFANLSGKVFVSTTDVAFDKSNFQLKLGKINQVKGVSFQDLKNALIPLTFPPANPQMMDIVRTCHAWGQESSQSPDVLSGGEVKSGEPYRSTAARIEQASGQIAVLTRKLQAFVGQMMKNHAKLLSYFMPETVTFSVPTYRGGEPITVTRSMFQREQEVLMSADMRFATQAQKITEADEILKMALQIPVLQSRPLFLYTAVRKSLEARGRSDMVQLLGPEPPLVASAPPPGGPAPGGPPRLGGPPPQGVRPPQIAPSPGNREQPPAMTGRPLGKIAGAQGNSLPSMGTPTGGEPR